MRPLSASAKKVQDALLARGFSNKVVEFEQPTRSAAEAAAAVGCQVADIAKSILFKAAVSGRPILVIASGANRIDERKVAAAIGEPVEKADAAFVRTATGYAIGGVPPVGHAQAVVILIDRDLLARQNLWAAAGTPNAVFPVTPDELLRLTGGQVADVARA